MKIQKDMVFAIIACVLILLLWDPFCRMVGWLPPKQQNVTAKAADKKDVPADKPAAVAGKNVNSEADANKKSAPVKHFKDNVFIGNRSLKLEINPNLGMIERVTMNDFLDHDRKGGMVINCNQLGKGLGALAVNDSNGSWRTLSVDESTADGLSYALVRKVTDGSSEFKVSQKWTLSDNGYSIRYALSILNPGRKELSIPEVVVSTGDLSTWKMHSSDKVRAASHRLSYMDASGDYDYVAADKKDSGFFLNPIPAVRWAAVSNKYYCAILKAGDNFRLFQKRMYLTQTGAKESVPAIASGAAYYDVKLGPGAGRDFGFEYYAGPKVMSELKSFDANAPKVMHLSSWSWMDYLARFMLWVLIKLNSAVKSYGLSIILLTLIVRVLFYPVTAKANSSMRRMQLVQPKLKELKEKYKDNPQLMNTKMMELYRAEGVNPLGGCLPILLQIPVFFALYATLDGAVELRHVAFLWSSDLSQADTVCRIFGLPINPLAIAMTALMLLQQRMMPSGGGDPMQRKMMLVMPLVMLLFLYDLPSGLTLYWTVSNFFSIIQLKLQQKYQAGPVQTPAK